MKDYKFQVSKVKTPEGNEYPLLVAQESPYAQVQIIPTTKGNQVERMQEAFLEGHPSCMASQGSSEFLALLVGVIQSKKEKVTQDNYKRIVQSLENCLQAGADFWFEYQKKHIILTSNLSLSYVE